MEEEVKFYSKVEWIFLVGACSQLVVFTIPVFSPKTKLFPVGFLFLVGFAFFLALHFQSLHWRKIYPLVVTEFGLKKLHRIAPASQIHWEDICEVNVNEHFLDLECPTVSDKPIKVPLFLEDQQTFYNYVCAHVHADNPLRVWIEALPERKLPVRT